MVVVKMGYDPLIRVLIKYENVDLIIEWESGLKIIGKLDTVFETDNGIEDSDINYKEYHAGSFRVGNIIEYPTGKKSVTFNWLLEKKGSLIEISLHDDPPNAIFLTNGQCVWRATD